MSTTPRHRTDLELDEELYGVEPVAAHASRAECMRGWAASLVDATRELRRCATTPNERAALTTIEHIAAEIEAS